MCLGDCRRLRKTCRALGRTAVTDGAKIVRLTTQTQPDGATQWSTRTLAAVAGVSDITIQRTWVAHGLKPHRVRRFKVSRDPQFVEKLDDIVGLYLSPPAHALVLCCDEKSRKGDESQVRRLTTHSRDCR